MNGFKFLKRRCVSEKYIPVNSYISYISNVLYDPYTFDTVKIVHYKNHDNADVGKLQIGRDHELWDWSITTQ